MPETHPQLSRRERRRLEIHHRILEAAVELFDTQGVEDTRIDDICERADLAQKTFFNHFPTKQHLFREIAQTFIGTVCALVEEARKQPGSTGERLAQVFRQAGEVARHRGPRHRELIQEVMRLSAPEAIGPPRDGGLPEAFHGLLTDGLEAGDVTHRQAPMFLTEMIVSALQGVVLHWSHDEDYSIEEHLEEAARFLCRAIASDKGADT